MGAPTNWSTVLTNVQKELSWHSKSLPYHLSHCNSTASAVGGNVIVHRNILIGYSVRKRGVGLSQDNWNLSQREYASMDRFALPQGNEQEDEEIVQVLTKVLEITTSRREISTVFFCAKVGKRVPNSSLVPTCTISSVCTIELFSRYC